MLLSARPSLDVEANAARRHRTTAAYFCVATVLVTMTDPYGLVALPIRFMLKDQLGLPPHAIAVFESVVLLPACGGFLLGIVRDRWRPAALGDRVYLVIGGPIAIGCYVWLTAASLTYRGLLIAVVIASIATQAAETAMEALMTTVGRRDATTGRLSAVAEVAKVASGVVAVSAGGWMATHASNAVPFATASALAAALVLFAVWRPGAVFGDRPAHEVVAPMTTADGARPLSELRRAPAYVSAVIALVLFNFSPGWATPLFYRFVDDVSMSGEGVGAYKAVTLAATAAAGLLYGVLCRRVSLRRLLFAAMVLNVFPGALLFLISSARDAIAAALGIGFVAGLGYVGLFDLLRRSCPVGHEGQGTALAFSAFTLAGIVGDLVGALLYERASFLSCIVLDAVATVLILPVVHRLPRMLGSSRDGVAHAPVVEVA